MGVGSSAPDGQREQSWWEQPCWELSCSEGALWLRGLCAQMSRNSKIKVVGAVLTPWCPHAGGDWMSHNLALPPHFIPLQDALWKMGS